MKKVIILIKPPMRFSFVVTVALASLLLVGAGCAPAPSVPNSTAGSQVTPPSAVSPTTPPAAAPTTPPAAAVDVTSSASGQTMVVIQNFAFNPPQIKVKKGTTVIWRNLDSAPHLVASDNNPAQTHLSGLLSSYLSSGEEYRFTFNTVGDFGYHCQVHPDMLGRVTVTE